MMLCSAVIVQWRFLKLCCMFVMYGRMLCSRVLVMTERSEMGLFIYLLGFDMSIMFDNFHMCGMMLFNAM